MASKLDIDKLIEMPKEERKAFLENKIYNEDQTQIFIETPYRNAKIIETILNSLRPTTKLCIAAGITCENEYIKTKTIAQWKKEKLPELGKTPAIFLLYK